MRSTSTLRSGSLTALLCLLLSWSSFHAADATLEGRLLAVQEDDFSGDASRRIHYIENEATGERTQLHLGPSSAPRLGSVVRASGTMIDGEMYVRDLSGSIDMLAPALAGGVDVRRAVVLVVDFADSNVGCSDSSIASLMFDGPQSVDALYQESSFGAVSFPGDTDGNGSSDLYHVSIANSVSEPCDPFGWATAADTAAQSSGVNLGLYQHRIYVLPGNTSCSWAGLANVGCFGTCRAWIETCHLPDVYAHEVGHNLGLNHASTDTDNDGTVDCEYCDRSDFMGIGGVGWRQVNGPHKLEMGWLSGAQVVEMEQQASQTVTLSPLETDPGLAPFPQVLRIVRANGDPYHVSYRVRAGYDATLNNTYADKANIHVHGGSSNTLFIDALTDGQTFVDAAADISIRQVSHNGGSVTLEVEVLCAGDPQCGGGGGGDPLDPVSNLRRTDQLP